MDSHTLESIKGVGVKTADKLRQMGLLSPMDVLRHLPRRYEDRSQVVEIQNVIPDQSNCTYGLLTDLKLKRYRNGGGCVEAAISNGSHVIHCIWFHSTYLMKSLSIGDQLYLFGLVEMKNHQRILIHPEIEKVAKDELKRIHMGRIVPFYSLAGDMSQRVLRTIMYEALLQYLPTIEDSLPSFLLKEEVMCNLKFALKEIHFPKMLDNAQLAHSRMVFDEFIAIRLTLFMKRKLQKTAPKSTVLAEVSFQKFSSRFVGMLPFTLTDDQMKAMEDIFQDFKNGNMNRLLQGDVGCGKTVVACFALYLCEQIGYQATLVVPTDILASQHHMTLSRYFAHAGIEVALLTSNTSAADRLITLEKIRDGKLSIVVGTHTLLSDKVHFKQLGLSIFDEQHKFGVQQRQSLYTKNQHHFQLLVSATPIPRTLALALYGEMTVSEIKVKGRKSKKKSTLWISAVDRAVAYKIARKEIHAGRQAYVVFPAISQSNMSIRSIEDSRELIETHLPNIDYSVIHGRMKKNEVQVIMDQFRNNEFPLLVATTVIEVGVDVSNATTMIIEGADRFGLSQLHQLRGRVGRGSDRSFCILIADTDNAETRDRLEAFSTIDDGFELAKKDLSSRGSGNLVGINQHGSFGTRIGDPIKHAELFEQSAKCAERIVVEYDFLKSDHFSNLRLRVNRLLEDKGIA